MKKLIRRLLDFLFILFFARRAALRLRSYLPLLGMTDEQVLVLPAQTGTSGVLHLCGFTIPTFVVECFRNEGKKGWTCAEHTLYVNDKGKLELATPNGPEPVTELSFSDYRALPVVRFLQSIAFFWPYSIYMTIEQSHYLRRLPPLKG